MKKSTKAVQKKSLTVPGRENDLPRKNSQKTMPSNEKLQRPEHHRWTFLTNHAHVLIVLHENSQMVLREVASSVGITERAVQRIVQDLEEEGFIKRTKVGRSNQYTVIEDKSLRHPIEAHRQIGDLLRLISEE